MSATASITRIHDLIDRWRALGSERLPSGVECIGRAPDGEQHEWLHTLFPALDERGLERLEQELQRHLPPSLRQLYRSCGGMHLFQGAFQVHGRCREPSLHDLSLQPEDLVALNRELDVLVWKPPGAVAFASNGWDRSLHVVGMGRTPQEVVRCDRRTGRIFERHENVFSCIEARLYRLDARFLR